jgi:hypothetical protein
MAVVVALAGALCLTANGAAAVTAQSAPGGAHSAAATSRLTFVQHSPMSGWVEHTKGDFSAFMPRDWVMTASQNGTNISSPTGVAVASFAYVVEDPRPTTDAAVLDYLLRVVGLSDVTVLHQTQPAADAGSMRQVTELLGHQEGMEEHAIFAVEVFNNYAEDSFGFDTYSQSAPAASWGQYKSTLQLIVDHISFLGQVSKSGEGRQ